MNPIEAYLQEKRAGFGGDFVGGLGRPFGGGAGFASTLGSGLSGAAAMGLAGATIAATGKGVQKLYDAATKSRDFKNMLEANPDLAQMHQEKPKQFNQMYNSLRSFTPEFSRDPVVAGTYVRQMMENPVGAGGIITQGIIPHSKLPQRGEHGTAAAIGGFKEHFRPQSAADMFAEEELGRKKELAPGQHALAKSELEHKQRMQEYTHPYEETEAWHKERIQPHRQRAEYRRAVVGKFNSKP
jgi:hypothetical protein